MDQHELGLLLHGPGYIDYGMLGAAQVDQYGNLNSTRLGGTYERPGRRFPGSGGGNEAASFVWKTIVVLKHEARRFVEKVDFLTSPGYLDGPGARVLKRLALRGKSTRYRSSTKTVTV